MQDNDRVPEIKGLMASYDTILMLCLSKNSIKASSTTWLWARMLLLTAQCRSSESWPPVRIKSM